MEFKHKPVMLSECIEGLNIKRNGVYVDGTIGGAGHSIEIAKKLDSTGMLIGIDKDEEALEAAKYKLSDYSNIKYVHANHDDLEEILKRNNIDGVDGILLDLGVSSHQIDIKERGFSYMHKDAPLDMRMDKASDLTAKNIINEYAEERLYEIIYKYGEEKFAKKIVRNICEARKNKCIETTGELVNIIRNSIPIKLQNNGHPAKKTFQAIRIEVNNEIEPLYNTVKSAIKVLKPHGRLCIITFHSIEDRVVKQAYISETGICTCSKELPYCVCGAVENGKIVSRKPILPTKNEQEENSRAKSAKLRIFEKN